MKFQTTKSNLLNTVLFVSRVINPKTSSLILNGLMIDTTNQLTLYSTDLETSIKSSIPVKVFEKGKAVVPARIFTNILKSFKESKVDVELNKSSNQVKITCENAVFTLNTLPLGEYPGFPEIKKERQLKISLKKFKNIVSKVQKAASVDESRAILTGIYIDINDGVLSMVATDSYRLALAKDEIEKGVSARGVVAPARVLDSIVKSEYGESDIEVNIEENQVSFFLGEENKEKDVIIARLLSGKFPEYNQLIPQKLKHNIVIDREKILDVVRRISSISQDNIPVKLTIEKGRISVSMNVREIGSSSEDFEVPYDEDKLEIAFNPEYLLDGINIIDSKNIIMSIDEPLKPILIKPEKKDNLIYLLMPIRIT